MRALLDLLLPPRCPGCGLEGTLLCAGCAAPLDRRLREPAGSPVGLPASMPPGLLQLEWCAMYSGSVRAALHTFKYGGERRLAAPLAKALADRWDRSGRGGDVVTWVPVHASRRRERGFDQAALLARCLAREAGRMRRRRLPVRELLRRRPSGRPQVGLGASSRRRAVAGQMTARRGAARHVAGRRVVVVDDVVTTGATVREARRVLERLGAVEVAVVACTRAEQPAGGGGGRI